MAAMARTILTPTDITLGRIDTIMSLLLGAGTAVASLSGSVESEHDRDQSGRVSDAIDDALNQLRIVMLDLTMLL
jgi:hypothetical protein